MITGVLWPELPEDKTRSRLCYAIWRDRKIGQKAAQDLAQIFRLFDEGFDTLDLVEARALLDNGS